VKLNDKITIVTGAASGIGRALLQRLAERQVKYIAAVDLSPGVVEAAQTAATSDGGITQVQAFVGNVTDPEFRRQVFDEVCATVGIPDVCVPAAGITRDRLAIKVDPETGKAQLYPIEDFRRVLEVNLTAPTYWGLELVARIAERRYRGKLKRWSPVEDIQGTVIFIGSVSSQGNAGQISYAATKAGLQGIASTLMKEAMYHGVRCMVIHPGFTDTPMVHALGDDFINKRILPATQLHRLIKPAEIADAVCFMIENPAVTGEIWADAGWHPSA
jgi:NAD(P)-dependent dehydrogenase (short-subunit alcohol dehydrogenase family)